MSVETYQGLTLSYERAASLVPDSYLLAYRWFLDHENEIGPRPWKEHLPEGMPIKLVAQSGIQKPSRQRYAVSVTIANPIIYGADSLIRLDDGTWTLHYCEHRHNTGTTPILSHYNDALLNCLRDGVPVGVFYKSGSGYRCLGLAFVENYNSLAGIFTLHGPVRRCSDDSLSPIPAQIVEEAARKAELKGADNPGEHKVLEFDYFGTQNQRTLEFDACAQQIRARQSATFKKELIEAYGGRCAISGYDALPALNATHISSYLGVASNKPSGGILLRADLGALYQQSLISIDPDSFEVAIGNDLKGTTYSHFDKRRIVLPAKKEFWPSRPRLEAHHRAFMQVNP